MHIVVGLGNPGTEFEHTRHNTGRMIASMVEKSALDGVKVVVPTTFMNQTGGAVAKVVKSKKAAKNLIVIYDDLDLPLGTMRISYDRGSGGHKGIESIIASLGTKEFIRIRVGVSPTTPGGKLKKPQGEKKVEDFILGEFKPAEVEVLKKVSKNAVTAVATIVAEGLQTAMTQFN